MKHFLKHPTGATSYEGVEITWIRGRVPEMTIKHDGEAVETINLSRYTEEKLHALFARKGLKRRFSYISGEEGMDRRAARRATAAATGLGRAPLLRGASPAAEH